MYPIAIKTYFKDLSIRIYIKEKNTTKTGKNCPNTKIKKSFKNKTNENTNIVIIPFVSTVIQVHQFNCQFPNC